MITLEDEFDSVFRDGEYLDTLRNDDRIDYVVPWYVDRDGEKRFHTAFVGRDDVLQAYSVAPESGDLEFVDGITFERAPTVREDGPWRVAVVGFGPDAEKVQEFSTDIEEFVEKRYQSTLLSPDGGVVDGARAEYSECSCESISSETVKLHQNSDRGYRWLICRECGHLHGIEWDSDALSAETVVDADWVLADFAGEIIEIGDDTDFVVRTGGNSPRLTAALDLLSNHGRHESRHFTDFEPTEQDALVFIADGEVAGFLSWDESELDNVLRQVYIPAGKDETSHGETLGRIWREEICSSESYYLEGPTESTRSLFTKLDQEAYPAGPEGEEYFALQTASTRST